MLPHLLHGDERKVWGYGGYQGQIEAIRQAAPQGKRHDLPPDQVQAVFGFMVSSLGLEPRTHALKVHCSTN